MNRLKQFQFLLLSILFTSGVTAERYSVNEDSFGGVSAKPVEAVTPTNNDSLSSNHALTNTLDNNHTDGEQAEETPQANDAAANQEVTSSAAINPRQDKLGPTKAIGEVPAKRKLSVFEKAYYDAERKAQAEALKNLQTSSQDSLGAYDATKVDPVKFMDGDELERTGARKDVEKAPYFITVDVDGKPINTHYDPVLVSEALDKQRNKKIEYTQARVYEEYNHTGNSAALDLPEGADPVAAQLLSSGEKEFNLYFEAFTQHCCQQLPNIVTPSVEFGRPRGFKLTQEDLYYRFNDGDSRFLLVRLPAEGRDNYPLRIRSFIRTFKKLSIDRGVFFPQIITLNTEYKPVRIMTGPVLKYQAETWSKHGYLEGVFQIDRSEEKDERYVLINTTRDVLRQSSVIDAENPIEIQHMSIGSFEIEAILEE